MSETRLVGTEAEIRISADSHMAEPFDLWEKRMPENLRDRAQRYREERAAYTDSKGPFIWATMVEADAWTSATGWLPGEPDA